jgi:hypothetical protein
MFTINSNLVGCSIVDFAWIRALENFVDIAARAAKVVDE